MAFSQHSLPASNAGQTSFVAVHQFGPRTGQKVYIQAGLHADEHPGLLVAQKFISKLTELERANSLNAHFVVVPFANPVGLRQRTFGRVTGRCDAHTGQNFNRGMSIPRELFNEAFFDSFGDDASANDKIMRAKLLSMIEQRDTGFEIEALHQLLLSHSIDAHYVIDLHCDIVALPHVFYGKHQHETGQQLAHCLGFPVCLEEDVTGTVAFDGTHTQPWVLAAQRNNAPKFEQPCFAATVELRGNNDVNETFANQDSEGLLTFFTQQGLITQERLPKQPVPLTTIGVEQVKLVSANAAGIVVYHRELNDVVEQGDLIAEIVLLDRETETRIAINAPCAGLLFSQTNEFYVSPGQTIGMLATEEAQNAVGSQLAF